MRSRIFPGRGSREIGLRLPTSDQSPGFCRGMTFAIFQLFGKVQVLSERLNV